MLSDQINKALKDIYVQCNTSNKLVSAINARLIMSKDEEDDTWICDECNKK